MERILKIYRASAGSGKTFTLALEYMKLLAENPRAYKSILAVTFTNKATGEMKERILGKLYGVANELESAKDYLDKMVEQLPHLSRETIIKNCKQALDNILHDYGHFRIQTIDAFFQTVLRSFAKELELNGDMEISLDGKKFLEEAVDTYIRNLEPEAKHIAPIIDFIEDKLEEGRDWHVVNDLKDFAENILKEEYQQCGDKLRKEMEYNDGVLLKEFYTKVSTKRQKAIQRTKDIGNAFFRIADDEGLGIEDFYGKRGNSGLWGFFTRLQSGVPPKLSDTNKNLIGSPTKISSKCTKVNEIAGFLKEIETLYIDKINCDLSLKHYHQLGMLNNIAKTLKEENEKENRFLLAETTHLLSAMIKENATFIFEKIGTEINHIFIDEFQDTSKLQWECFKVLLDEILARNNFNLIVGDVKQSIYRWRNSDWNIMNTIGTKFREDQIVFADQSTIANGRKLYSTNYRSDSNIITFNNMLYNVATESIAETQKKKLDKNSLDEMFRAYQDVEQAIPEWQKPNCGYAEIRIIAKSENEEEKFRQSAIKELMKTLHRLIEEENVVPGNIAILLRYNKGINDIVTAFNAEFPDIKIVSDEAYRLSSSLTLQLVISAMRYIASPEDNVNIANLVRLYAKVVEKRDETFEEDTVHKNMADRLPAEFREKLMHFQSLPIYELIEQLLQAIEMSEDKNEEAYIYTFLDYASQYLTNRTSDLNGFIEAWDNEIYDKSIPAEEINSVRLMTIHKSKGLEFHTVIVPLCDWTLTGDNRNSLWCTPTEEPYNTLSLLSVPLKKEMPDSIYSKEYNNEFLYQIVDNLNILYVATTRAKSNLFLFSDGTGGKKENISKLLNRIVNSMTALVGSKYENGVFEFGSIVPSEVKSKDKEKDKKPNENPFEAKPQSIRQPFVYHNNRITFRQSKELARFLATDKDEKKQFRNIAEGVLLHQLMSGINKADDISKALDKLMIEGLISTDKQYDRIKKLIENAIANPYAADWFTGKYKLYNECSILVNNNETTRRPDRVMINGKEAIVVDYKFAKESDEYPEQVRRYMRLLTQMGYENVRGYLWYVYKNKIEEVKNI